MENYNTCTTTIFKTDISELCSKCPLADLIHNGIKNQIIFQANQVREISTDNQYKEYIDSEIKNAQKAMQGIFLTEQQNKDYLNDPHRKDRVEIYIWNKERIKALNATLNENHKEQKQTSIIKTVKPSKEEDFHKVKEILKPLNGYWNRKLILNNSDYSRLIEYTFHIMKYNSLPNETKKFPNTGTSIEFIRKTLHLVYSHFGKQNKDCFISLTHLFKQLDNTDSKTTNSKFSAYNGNYDNDVKKMITY